jgi:tRNA 2-thiouridine synthesizing protein A
MEPVETVDARGLRCPMPVIRLERALRSAPHGAVVRIAADDLVAPVDIAHFAREAGWECRRLADENGACVFLVTRNENR